MVQVPLLSLQYCFLLCQGPNPFYDMAVDIRADFSFTSECCLYKPLKKQSRFLALSVASLASRGTCKRSDKRSSPFLAVFGCKMERINFEKHQGLNLDTGCLCGRLLTFLNWRYIYCLKTYLSTLVNINQIGLGNPILRGPGLNPATKLIALGHIPKSQAIHR